MKVVTRAHRVFAILLGIALLVTLVIQIWRDGRHLEMKHLKELQSTTK